MEGFEGVETKTPTLDGAFAEWWQGFQERFPGSTPKDTHTKEYLRKLFLACFITGAGWAMARPPAVSLKQIEAAYEQLSKRSHPE